MKPLYFRLVHWDVNNENLHGDYYERHTGDPDITHKMFQWIHSKDPSIKLFLNDFSILPKSDMTTVSLLVPIHATLMCPKRMGGNCLNLQKHFLFSGY